MAFIGAGLNISFSETSSVGTQVTSKSDELNALLTKIRNINDRVQSCWQDAAATKYFTKIDQQEVDMQQLVTTVNEIGVFLGKVASAYQATVDANTIQG